VEPLKAYPLKLGKGVALMHVTTYNLQGLGFSFYHSPKKTKKKGSNLFSKRKKISVNFYIFFSAVT
jgi:hypothetical protein